MPARSKINKKELIELYSKNWSITMLSKRYGVTKGAICYSLKHIKHCPKCGEVLL